MTTALDICNRGLAKIGASRISQLMPPRTPLERHCSANYPHWRDSELSGARRWTCALAIETLAQTNVYIDTNGITYYVYDMPVNAFRPVRTNYSQWIQRGQKIYDPSPTFTAEFITRISEDTMDPFFIEVLACRVAKESAEFATQSSTKGESADSRYNRALADAARANAVQIGPEPMMVPEVLDEWITARYF